MAITTGDITAVILAGGSGERMGGVDKGLIHLDGKTLVQHLVERLQPQVEKIVINANRNIEIYRELGYPVIEDTITGFAGPLAGIDSVMRTIDTPYILTVPCDTPKIPKDLVRRLVDAANDAGKKIAVVHDHERLQPAHALLPVSLKHELDSWIVSGRRSIQEWLTLYDFAVADFSDKSGAFINLNTPSDLLDVDD